MTTPIVSRNPLVSHCTVVAETSRSPVRCGSATLRMVSLRIITNAETTSVMMITIGRADPLVVLGPAVSDPPGVWPVIVPPQGDGRGGHGRSGRASHGPPTGERFTDGGRPGVQRRRTRQRRRQRLVRRPCSGAGRDCAERERPTAGGGGRRTPRPR